MTYMSVKEMKNVIKRYEWNIQTLINVYGYCFVLVYT